MDLKEVCEQISSTSLKTSVKTDLYKNGCAIFDSFPNGELPEEVPLTTQAFINLHSDLTAQDEEVRETATHFFLTLLHFSTTITPPISERPDSWTLPFRSFLEDESSMVQTCFPLLASTDKVTQQKSLKIVMQCIQRIKSWAVSTNEEAHVILMQIVEKYVLPRLEKMLGEPERQEVLAMRIWQQLIHSIGNYIPQTNHDLINRLLKLIEFCFKNTRQEVQVCAYTSWSILMQTFSLHRTYLVKKLRLFTVPLLSCAVKQEHRYAIVDVERAKTWRQLMLSLMCDLQDHANTVYTPFFFFCIGLDPKLTLCKEFNEVFKTHFSSKTTSDNPQSHQTVSQVLTSIENNMDFMSLLSSLGTQHLPKKALSDPEIMCDWRRRLCTEGIHSLSEFLSVEFGTNQNLSAVRDKWVRDNYRVLVTLVGLWLHLFDPSEGSVLTECFRQVTCTLESSGEVDSVDLLYSSLVVIQTAVANNHTPHTVVSLIESVCTSVTGQLSLPLCDSTGPTASLVLTELLLDNRVLQLDDMPEAFFSSYKQLINCNDINSRGIEEYQHFLSKIEVSHNVQTLWRGWKITGEALLTTLQMSNDVEQENLSDNTVILYILSYLLTKVQGSPDSYDSIQEYACLWKKLAGTVINHISEGKCNDFINSICQIIYSLTESQLNNSKYLFFLTLLLEELVSFLDLSHSIVFCDSEEPDKLGNINFCISAISKLLKTAYFSEIPDTPNGNADENPCKHISASRPVSSLIITTTHLFSHLDDPLLVSRVLEEIAAPIGLYFVLANQVSSSSQTEHFCLLDDLWAAVKSSILSSFESYNTQFLLILCPILIPLSHTADKNLLASVTEFFSRSFISSKHIQFPDSLNSLVASIMSQEGNNHQLDILGKSKGVHDPEASREDISPKRIKLSGEASLNKEIDLMYTNCPELDSDSVQIISSSETATHSMDTAAAYQTSFPCEEDPFPHTDSVINLLDDKESNDDVIDVTPTRLMPPSPDSTSSTSSNCLLKPQLKSYSEQKLKLKQTKFIRIPVSDKPNKLKGNWPPSPNEKEKKAFFKLELTPIRLEEFPKSSPTHTSVNRKLQFPADASEQQEGVPIHQGSPEVQILDLDFETVLDDLMNTSDVENPKIDPTQIDLDSIEEFIKDIPLSDIISPDELLSMNNDDVTMSQSTNSLIVLSSCSLSQSITPPTSQTETPFDPIAEAESIIAFNDCIKVESDSVSQEPEHPVVPVDEEAMDLVEEKEEVPENNISIDSLATQDDILDSSVIVKYLSPEGSATQSSNQLSTPKQSILKKHSHFSPSPNFKKVSFADPIHKTHAIRASPKSRRLRNQKQNSASKLTSSTTSIGTRRTTRLGVAAPTTNPDDPVCVSLIDCTESVDALVPFLTSQSVSWGITGLFKAKKIHTIGDLAVLSEREAEALPIQLPKLQTLRIAFSKFQVTQFRIPSDLTRQSSNPLFFPLAPVEEQNTGQDGDIAEEQDQVVPFLVSEAVDNDYVSVSIPEYPVEEIAIETAPELVSSSVQTDATSSASLITELTNTLPGELQNLSQGELTAILTSLCQLVPSIADRFQPNS